MGQKPTTLSRLNCRSFCLLLVLFSHPPPLFFFFLLPLSFFFLFFFCRKFFSSVQNESWLFIRDDNGHDTFSRDCITHHQPGIGVFFCFQRALERQKSVFRLGFFSFFKDTTGILSSFTTGDQGEKCLKSIMLNLGRIYQRDSKCICQTAPFFPISCHQVPI